MGKKCLFILSPGFGMYSNSLNLLKEIQINDYKIDILLPKPLGYLNLEKQLKIILRDICFEKIIYNSNPLSPFSYKKKNYRDFCREINSPEFSLQMRIRIFLAKIYNKIKFPLIERNLFSFYRFVCYLLVKYINFKKKEYELLVYDITEEEKLYILGIIPLIYKTPRISLHHGVDIYNLYMKRKKIWVSKNNLCIFLYTGKDVSRYKKIYDIPWEKCELIGIRKHLIDTKKFNYESKKISDKIKSNLNLDHDTKFITLISRPEDNINYCSPNSRKTYLKIIGSYINQNKNWHLLIKKHPKEENYNLEDLALQLQLDETFNRFSITNLDVMELASLSYIGLCYHSSCCVDFAFFKKPMIEMTDICDTEYARLTINYDNLGRPESGYSANNLAISIKNKNELNHCLNNIEETYIEMSKKVSEAYKNCFVIKKEQLGIDKIINSKLNIPNNEGINNIYKSIK